VNRPKRTAQRQPDYPLNFPALQDVVKKIVFKHPAPWLLFYSIRICRSHLYQMRLHASEADVLDIVTINILSRTAAGTDYQPTIGSLHLREPIASQKLALAPAGEDCQSTISSSHLRDKIVSQ
jgi:hypothetical protein